MEKHTYCVQVKEEFPEVYFSFGRGANFRTLQEAKGFLMTFCETQRELFEIV